MIRKTNDTEGFKTFVTHAERKEQPAGKSVFLVSKTPTTSELISIAINSGDFHSLTCTRCGIKYSWYNDIGSTKKLCAPCVPLAAKEYRVSKKKEYRKEKRVTGSPV